MTNENTKHKNWYAETLILYELEFEEKPPFNIWPIPKNKTPNIKDEININANIDITTSTLCFIIVLSAFINSAIFFNRINPFELRGQQFLLFFAYLLIATIMSVVLILNERRKIILPYLNTIFPTDYNLFQATHFLYGKSRAIQTALIHLFIKDIFELENNRFKYNAKNAKYYDLSNPLFSKTQSLKDDITLSYQQIETQLYTEQLFVHPAFLKLEQLIKSKIKAPHYLFAMVILIGVARIIQGISNDKPVIYLFFEILVFVVAYWIIYMNYDETAIILKESLNRIKNDGFNEIETESGILQQFAQNGNQALKGFGEYFTLAGIFATYPVLYQNRSYVSGGYSISGGSSDSGSDSCGSSDGGGSGCGGGGCGGCGGGGD